MNRPQVNVARICGLLLLATWATAAPVAADTTGGVRGVVLEEPSGQPEVGATVHVQSARFSADVRSGRGGFFALVGIPPGRYFIAFNNPNGETAGGCEFLILNIVAGEVRSLRLVNDTRYRGLLSCRVVLKPLTVDADQTAEVHSFDSDGNPLP